VTHEPGSGATPPTGLPRHRIYGLTMASDFPFRNRLAKGTGAPNLVFTRVHEAPEDFDPNVQPPIHVSVIDPGDRLPFLRVFVLRAGSPDEVLVLNYPQSADHFLYPDRIVTHLRQPACDYLVEIQLLGDVLSVWLERQGLIALHASAVVVGDAAIGFLASNKGGKTSLAASLMQAGCPLLTDDILPLEATEGGVIGHPGFPQMRMWPEVAAHFLGDWSDMEIVHPAFTKRRIPVGPQGLGSFQDRPAPLARLFVPEMIDDDRQKIEMEPLSTREVLAQLLGNSFAADWIDALGWQHRRLAVLARTASAVPILRLRYPRGMDRLPQARQAILDSCTQPSGAGRGVVSSGFQGARQH
jgi:hypothetical protein